MWRFHVVCGTTQGDLNFEATRATKSKSRCCRALDRWTFAFAIQRQHVWCIFLPFESHFSKLLYAIAIAGTCQNSAGFAGLYIDAAADDTSKALALPKLRDSADTAGGHAGNVADWN